ncbi:uncharacterized protein BO96DRAFT_78425 [Aspergillus niger CBS 101883]|uniref:uncharacterized protein n=1 Tax=Aspergillus lacticoffeatus (strain CBS 101883) TaxID=1450533 RepID=UPI000D803522|nr:uncharacterized protein BO96DRAFT_78425 [Aspergillus niger CBS 101883]PYH55118.1 hypothetical protein BO96DRAFT_78425 [Aspergillus niger CBS 101883]
MCQMHLPNKLRSLVHPTHPHPMISVRQVRPFPLASMNMMRLHPIEPNIVLDLASLLRSRPSDPGE